MKCPNCGNITNWDTLQCPCGFDGEHPAPPPPSAAPHEPLQRVPQLPILGRAILSFLWAGGVIVVTLAAGYYFLCAGIGGSIGTPDGAGKLPFQLLFLSPLAAVVLMIGGIFCIFSWQSPSPSAATASSHLATPRSRTWKLTMSILWVIVSCLVTYVAAMAQPSAAQPSEFGGTGPSAGLDFFGALLAPFALNLILLTAGLIFIFSRPPMPPHTPPE